MRLGLVFSCVACAACAHVPPSVHPLALAPPPRMATLAERKADVCGSATLVPLEGPLVAGSTAPPETGIVKSVSVRDAANHDVEVSAETLAFVHRDVEIDPAAARLVVKRLWTTGRFDDIAIETARADDGIALVFRVTPKREIANVFAAPAEDADLDALRVVHGELYDPVALVSARRALEGSLAKDGRLDATVIVSSAFADADHRALDVCVRVLRGPRVTLDRMDVRGGAHASALSQLLSVTDDTNVHGAVLDEAVVERDVLVLAAWLYDQGHLAHKIEKTIERRGDELSVFFDVTDGPVYRYASIDVRGDLAAPKGEYTKLVTAKPGDVFDRSAMMKVIESFRTLDKTKGHEAIEIEPETTLDAAKHTVALVLSLRDTKKLSIVELHHGSGRAVVQGDHVSVQYKGMLTDGTVFDTSTSGPFDFTLGGGMVIQGFEQGVMGMKIGGKRRVTIPPAMGYGARGAPPKIPANAALVFEIELVAIR